MNFHVCVQFREGSHNLQSQRSLRNKEAIAAVKTDLMEVPNCILIG